MRKGFTLIELVVVIAIIAILAAIIAPNAFKSIEKARISGVEGDLRTIKTGAMSYYADTGTWPANGNTTIAFVDRDASSGWDGPYLEKWPQRNPWGGTYAWRSQSTTDFHSPAVATRYVVATLIPGVSCNKVDFNLDDGVNSNGVVRCSAVTGTATMMMEISNDKY